MTTTTSKKKYEAFTQIEHVLKRPDMYLGSIETVTEQVYTLDSIGSENITYKNITYNPAIVHLVSELIVNATDNIKNNTKNINITITEDAFIITNDGDGIDLSIQQEYNIYTPELIFGRMLTGSNFDDETIRTTGGKNGIGAKACNIFSKEFLLELRTSGETYTQLFKNNMSIIDTPKITKPKSTTKTIKPDSVTVTFKPDFSRFKIDSFYSDDNYLLICKRIIDSSVINCNVKWTLNGAKLKGNFNDYINKYFNGKNTENLHFSEENWDVYVVNNSIDDVQLHYQDISFVNGIYTEDNGTHVKYIKDQIHKMILEKLSSVKAISEEYITPKITMKNVMIFVNCIIGNPKFDSQNKKKLNTPSKDFKWKCNLTDKYCNSIIKLCSIKESLILLTKEKNDKLVNKAMSSTGKTMSSRMTNILKLVDATNAGPMSKSTFDRIDESKKCTLILTEGDSAKSFAIKGLIGLVDPNTNYNPKEYYGIFPLKGKPLNVKTATSDQLKNNVELGHIVNILGLKRDPNLTTEPYQLRYQKVLILADSDLDGFHIKGLLISYFTTFWKDLVTKDFINVLMTPIVKVSIKNPLSKIPFYSLDTYETWCKNNINTSYTTKYYKGLGTSEDHEAEEYFRDHNKLLKVYTYDKTEDSEDNMAISLSFDKNRADDRKEQIKDTVIAVEKGLLNVDYSMKRIPVHIIMSREVAKFSVEDTCRSIPNIIDGQKPCQRKILYSFLRNNSGLKERKVANASSTVSADTSYAHGEVSIQGTIVNMAQTFVGSGNNVALLGQKGNFGSRSEGGSDAASSRYISVVSEDYLSLLFNEYDFLILDRNMDDKKVIEPKYFVPIVPLILLNSSVGIGTGYSTNIPSFNVKDVLENIRSLLKNKNNKIKEMIPYYEGFRGTIFKISDAKTNVNPRWKCRGVFERINSNTVKVTELPIGLWYGDFQDSLNKHIENKVVTYYNTNFSRYATESEQFIEYTITFAEDISDENVVEHLKLEKIINGTNLVGFDKDHMIRRYEHPEEILFLFYKCRLEFYVRRKEKCLNMLEHSVKYLSERARFIRLIIEDVLIINKKSIENVEKDLVKNKFIKMSKTYIDPKDSDIIEKYEDSEDSKEESEDEETPKNEKKSNFVKSFDYLLNMHIKSLTKENIEKLQKEVHKLELEYKALKNLSPEEMWSRELDKFEELLEKVKLKKLTLAQSNNKLKTKSNKIVAVKKKI